MEVYQYLLPGKPKIDEAAKSEIVVDKFLFAVNCLW